MTAAEALIEIKRLIAAGLSASKIAAALTAQGYLTRQGTPFIKGTVIGRASRAGIAFPVGRGSKPLDLAGMTSGRLTVIGRSEQRDGNGRIRWLCRLARAVSAETMRKVRLPGRGRPRRDPAVRAQPPARKPAAPTPKEDSVTRKFPAAPKPAPIIAPIVAASAWKPLPASEPRSLMDLRTHDCRWPIDGENGERLFCAAPAELGHPYCASHEHLSMSHIARTRARFHA